MIRVDMYSGMLGVGKTTLIRRMLETAYRDQLVVIVENEIGKVNFDSAVLGSAGIRVEKITGGCICCTVAGDIQRAIRQIGEEIHPDVIVIEPTGASDVAALMRVVGEVEGVAIGRSIMVLKAHKCHALLSVVGDFYREQIQCADVLFLNFIEQVKEGKLEPLLAELREINPRARIVMVPMDQITADTFPENTGAAEESRDEEGSSGEDAAVRAADRSLKVADAETSVPEDGRMRGVRRRKASEDPTIYTWEYTFRRPWTEEDVAKLSQWLSGPLTDSVWRVKGILTMEDGSRRKYDVSFGDVFCEEWTTDGEVPENTLVFIGPDIPKNRLRREFEGM